jgi:hypothetical protein
MKKLLLTLLLLLSFTLTSAQTEFTRIYTKICTIEKDKEPQWKSAENKFIFNYKEDTILKIVLNDGTIRFFNQVTDLEKNRTEGGVVYQAAEFREQGTNFTVYIQIFDDVEYGTRIVFTNGTMVQFTN